MFEFEPADQVRKAVEQGRLKDFKDKVKAAITQGKSDRLDSAEVGMAPGEKLLADTVIKSLKEHGYGVEVEGDFLHVNW